MSTENDLWPDDFEIDDAEMELSFDEEGANTEPSAARTLAAQRPLAAWRRVEDRFDDLKLRNELSDWDDWDESLDP